MLTLELHINPLSDDIIPYLQQYTGLFYKLYNNENLIENKSTIKELLQENNLLDKTFYDFCKAEVKTKLNQQKTAVKNKEKLTEDIIEELSTKEFKTIKDKRYKYKLIRKSAEINRNINKNICFGGKANLRNITKYKQKLQHEVLTNEEKQEIELLLDKIIKDYKRKRLLGLYMVGRACEKGNRKIDFDLLNHKIIFKPDIKNHFEIPFREPKSKKNKRLLYILNTLANDGELALTVRINRNTIDLCYDDEKVNGFAFDEVAYFKELKTVAKENELERKEIYIKHKEDQKNRMLKGKIIKRFSAFDDNPNEFGVVIADRPSDNDPNLKPEIIHKVCFSLKDLSKKLNLKSDDKKQKWQNNKLRHEIKEMWKQIFEMLNHYKVAYFVCEDIKLKNAVNNQSKEFNRKTKNKWHRTLTNRLIAKWCNVYGVQLIGINPAYSSFIGNLLYPYYDPISSACEICRRGMVKYIKGCSLYPSMDGINREKLVYLLGENTDVIGNMNWVQLYKVQPHANWRVRNKSKTDLVDNYLLSSKSKVRVYTCV